jgi:hypothetical protein
MTREQHAITRLHWMRRGILFVATAWLGLAVLISTLLLLDAWRLEHVADQEHAASSENRAKEARLLAKVGGAAVLDQRLQAVQTWQNVATLDQYPATLFQKVMVIGEKIGNLHFQRMEWAGSASAIPGSPPVALSIEGEISPFDNDFRAAHQRVQRLVDQLQASLPDGQVVTVKRWPLNTATNTDLEGEFGHSHVNARFQIEVTGGVR